MKSTLATRVSSTRFFAIGRVSRREDSTTDTRSTLSKVRECASTESRDKTQRIISLSLDTRLVSTVIGTFESSGNSAAKKGVLCKNTHARLYLQKESRNEAMANREMNGRCSSAESSYRVTLHAPPPGIIGISNHRNYPRSRETNFR